MRRLRKMTWVLIVWSGLCLIWAVAGIAGNECAEESGSRYLSQDTAESACEAGTAIGVGLIFGLWFMGFVVLSLIWFMTRPKED